MKAGPFIRSRFEMAVKTAQLLRAQARAKEGEAVALRNQADEFDAEAMRWASDTDILQTGKTDE